ncbi:FAD-dependent oxidoreductase [Luteococcus sp. H138]|uniref:FAD-dependent oxidoreductase n=1 Tax=unclassified Luteococcus TaxID=2639923 RepID=UPI00313DA263
MTSTPIRTDVLVIGSGAAGMGAALKASEQGHSVLVVEQERHLGGTTAICGGWGWVPGNKGAEPQDSRDQAKAYIKALAGHGYREEPVDAFLNSIPEALDFYERQGVRIVYGAMSPDYQMDAPGAMEKGRAVTFERADARMLGEDRLRVQPYLMPYTVFGYMPEIGTDIARMVKANQSVGNFAYAARNVLTAWGQTLLARRAWTRTNGNALMTWIFAAAREAGIRMWTGTRAERLLTDERGVVVGAELSGGHAGRVEARLGVVLACGGFGGNAELRRRYFQHDPDGDDHVTPTIGHDGSALRLAEPLGGYIDNSPHQPASWGPITPFHTLVRRKQTYFPHLRAFGLPGLIAVDRTGRRFANESLSYHDYGIEMIKNDAERDRTYVWIIADATAMRKYGIGYAKPWPFPPAIFQKEGYLRRATTVEALAGQINVDPQSLRRTIEEFNQGAARGEDPAFGRGSLKYHNFKGDLEHRPNPNLAPLTKAPWYAVRVMMGDLGTYAGLAVNSRSEVLDEGGRPVPGLYAVGSAAVSVFGGGYPGYGAHVGPALVFSYRIGRDIAAHAAERGRGEWSGQPMAT